MPSRRCAKPRARNGDRRPPVTATARPRKRRLWPALVTVALLIAAGALYAVGPRHADLTAVAPAAMARLETALWRSFYEKRYVALFRDLYSVSREQYNFSPLDTE